MRKDHRHDNPHGRRLIQIAGKLRAVERATVIQMRNKNEIGDQVLRTLERELDLLDVRFALNDIA